MGLFSNNKKLCPICGSPTPRLLATKIEDTPICKECDRKIDLPDGAVQRMPLEDFRQYMAFYTENQPLREVFTETARYDFRFLDDDIVVDGEHGLFRLRSKNDGLVFESSCLKGFRIWEDRNLLFEGGREALRCFESDTPSRASALQGEIDRFVRDRQQFEQMDRMRRMMEQQAQDSGQAPPSRPYVPEPRFEIPGPIRKFRMEITLDHPYWPELRAEWDAPEFHPFSPSVGDYLDEYHETAEALYALSRGLMELISPGARELRIEQAAADQITAAQTRPAGDAIGEIAQYKTLLDAGVITEEEFTAKKRLLLGI